MLRLATCQFPVSARIERNRDYMIQQMQHAAAQGARLVHFGECALSGYCGLDFDSWSGYDWILLASCTQAVCRAANAIGIWVMFGSSHPLTGDHLPHNCVYVVDDKGQLVTRYDKRRCSIRDLNNYTPGDAPSTFEVDGVTFGVLICLDYRFPELYHKYMEMGVDCVLHSFHDARKSRKVLSTIIAPPTLQGHAGNYVLWLSVANNSAPYQAFRSMFIDPSGAVQARAKRHRPDVILSVIDFTKHQEYVQMVRAFRSDARSGAVYDSKRVSDPRSDDRSEF